MSKFGWFTFGVACVGFGLGIVGLSLPEIVWLKNVGIAALFVSLLMCLVEVIRDFLPHPLLSKQKQLSSEERCRIRTRIIRGRIRRIK